MKLRFLKSASGQDWFCRIGDELPNAERRLAPEGIERFLRNGTAVVVPEPARSPKQKIKTRPKNKEGKNETQSGTSKKHINHRTRSHAG
jgi:hypothetical protein